MILDSPFYAHVPKLPDQHLEWRRALLSRAMGDRGLQRDLLLACRMDLLFWINTFAYVYEPRAERKVLPFNTYPYQDVGLSRLSRILGRENAIIEKSRDLGGTWMVLMLFLWAWLFQENVDFGVVSHDMDACDKTGSKGTLFWKLRAALGKEKGTVGLPSWMTPPYKLNIGTLVNEDNGSSILGFAATGNVMRGDRKTAVLLDEFAAFPRGADHDALSSVQFVTNCVILMSTPDPAKGASGAFFDEVQKARALAT